VGDDASMTLRRATRATLAATIAMASACALPPVTLECDGDVDCPVGQVCTDAVCVVGERAGEGEGDAGEGEGEGDAGEGEGEGDAGEGEGEGEGEGDAGEGEGEGDAGEGEGEGDAGEGEGEGELACGNGALDGDEQCDTGTEIDAACVDCAIRAGFTCVYAPSICVPDADVRDVDDDAPDGVTRALAELGPEPGRTVVIRVSGDGPYDGIGNQDGKGRIVVVGNPRATFVGAGPEAFKAKNDTQLLLVDVDVSAPGNTHMVKSEGALATVLVDGCVLGPTNAAGVVLKNGARATVTRTVIDGCATNGVLTEGDDNTLLMDNSIVVRSDGAGFLMLDTTVASIALTTIADHGGAGVDCAGDSVIVRASLIAGNGDGATVGACALPDTQTPADRANANFADDGSTAAEEFAIGGNSVCLDAVTDEDGLAPYDIALDARPQGNAFDCGADERAP
jgi:hypothetical protein